MRDTRFLRGRSWQRPFLLLLLTLLLAGCRSLEGDIWSDTLLGATGTYTPWLPVVSGIAFVQMALLTPGRRFSWRHGLRFAALGMGMMLAVIIPLEFVVQALQAAANCNVNSCTNPGIFPDPFIEEAGRFAAVLVGVWLVKPYRRGHLSDFLFWTVAALIGANLVEDTFRFAGASTLGLNIHQATAGRDLLDTSQFFRWFTTFLPGGFIGPSADYTDSRYMFRLPELAWFVSAVPATIGLWLAQQPDRRRAGLWIMGIGYLWAVFDHSMYNWFVLTKSFMGVPGAWSEMEPWIANVWRVLGQGHVPRWVTVAALGIALVWDERIHARELALRFGERWLHALRALQANWQQQRSPAKLRLVVAGAGSGLQPETAVVAGSQPQHSSPDAPNSDAKSLSALPRWWMWLQRIGVGTAVLVITLMNIGGIESFGWFKFAPLRIIILLVVGIVVVGQLTLAGRLIPKERLFAVTALLGIWGIIFLMMLVLGLARPVWNIGPLHAIDQLLAFLRQLFQHFPDLAAFLLPLLGASWLNVMLASALAANVNPTPFDQRNIDKAWDNFWGLFLTGLFGAVGIALGIAIVAAFWSSLLAAIAAIPFITATAAILIAAIICVVGIVALGMFGGWIGGVIAGQIT